MPLDSGRWARTGNEALQLTAFGAKAIFAKVGF